MMMRGIYCAVVLSLGGLAAVLPARAEPVKPPTPVLSPSLEAQAHKAIDQGLAYLRSKQDKDGGWTAKYGPAVTAIVAQAFAQDDDYGPRHPIVRRAVSGILRYQQSDGGIYERRQNLANYQTSIVLMLLASLDDPQYKARVAKAHDIYRMKGFVSVPGKAMRHVIQGVGGRLQGYFDRPWRDDEPRRSQIVVIGAKDLDRQAITAALQA